MRAYLAMARQLSALEPVSAIVVLASGVYLASVASFWTVGWVQVAMAFWVVNAAVAGALVHPAMGRVAEALSSSPDGPVGADLHALRWSGRWSIGGDLLLADDAAMLWLMVIQPGLAGSLMVVAIVNVAIGAARVMHSRGHAAYPRPVARA
jgi:hypothetical protein